MTTGERTGLLLLNLGTPDEPTPGALRRYLREFLGDPRVIDLPGWARFLLLNLIILPFRPRVSAAAYRQIWNEKGSPLLLHGRALAEALGARLRGRARVELAMRYGRPSIGEALDRLQAAGVDRLAVFPLYPQYSAATTGSSLEAVYREAGRRWNTPALTVVPPFFDDEGYLGALAAVVSPCVREFRPDRVLLSFHGLPERQVRRGDSTGSHCLVRDDCCDRPVAANRFCYRAHCLATARSLREVLGLEEGRMAVSFQSRLGRTPWLGPYTDEVLGRLPGEGARRVLVVSPSFVADCLETLEELGLRGERTFREAGGEDFLLAPCLNLSEPWVEAAVTLAGRHLPGEAGGPAAPAGPGGPE